MSNNKRQWQTIWACSCTTCCAVAWKSKTVTITSLSSSTNCTCWTCNKYGYSTHTTRTLRNWSNSYSGAAQVALMEPAGLGAVVTMAQLSDHLHQQYDIDAVLLLREYRVRGLIISYYIHHRAIYPSSDATIRPLKLDSKLADRKYNAAPRTSTRRLIAIPANRCAASTAPHCRIIVRTRHNHNYRHPKQWNRAVNSTARHRPFAVSANSTVTFRRLSEPLCFYYNRKTWRNDGALTDAPRLWLLLFFWQKCQTTLSIDRRQRAQINSL